MNEKILIFGGASTALTLSVTDPDDRQDLIADCYETVPGGHGETASLTVARLGGNAVFCGRVGDDSGGKRLCRLLDETGVDLSCFTVDKTAQTDFSVTILHDGEVASRIRTPGADGIFCENEIREAFLSAPSLVCFSEELPAPARSLIASLANKNRIPMFFNAIGGGADCTDLGQLRVYYTDGETAYRMTGARPTTAENCLSVAIAMQKYVTADQYVIRLGERGTFIYDGTFCHMANSYILRETDPRGADDVFFGAMALEYLRNGQETVAACAYAGAAAALCSARHGEATSVPTGDEVLSFLEKS